MQVLHGSLSGLNSQLSSWLSLLGARFIGMSHNGSVWKLKYYTSSSCCIYFQKFFQKVKSAFDSNPIPFPESCFAIPNPVAMLEKNNFLDLFLSIQQHYIYSLLNTCGTFIGLYAIMTMLQFAFSPNHLL